MKSQNTVNTPSKAYGHLEKHWRLPDALRGGTLAMRAAGDTYLPQFPAESSAAYDERLSQSILFNAFWQTVTVLAAKPFVKPITLGDSADEQLLLWTNDIDRAGRNITAFAHDLLRDLLAFGVCRFAVDFPTTRTNEGDDPLTLEEERAAGLRPYFAQLDPLATIEARRGFSGTFERVRIRETDTRLDSDWGEVDMEQVRVITPDAFDVYVKTGDEWPTTPTTSYPNTLKAVPVVEIGFLVNGRPPLDDLGWLNLRHWQSQSDQENILHVARVPFKHFAGFSTEEVAVMEVGRNKAVRSTNPESKINVVEHSGEAIAAGRTHLQDLKEEMSGFGLDLLVPRKGDVTATGRIIDREHSDSDLQMMTRRLEVGLEQGLAFMGKWAGREIDAQVDIFQDFNYRPDDGAHDQRLKRASAGFLSARTLLEEDRRAGLVRDDLDVDDELAEIADTEGDDIDIADDDEIVVDATPGQQDVTVEPE